MGVYKLADINIEICCKYEFTNHMLEEYKTTDLPNISISIDEKKLLKVFDDNPNFSKGYLESLEIYREICNQLISFNTFLFHSSCVVKDKVAYLFTAVSGTGKSTHTNLWVNNIEGCFILNDDKPLIRLINDDFYVYGTPWSGKDNIHKNDKAKIKAICLLTRSKDNWIKTLDANEAIKVFINQTIWFDDKDRLENLLYLIDQLIKKVKIYKMGCNMNSEAALMSYNFMK